MTVIAIDTHPMWKQRRAQAVQQLRRKALALLAPSPLATFEQLAAAGIHIQGTEREEWQRAVDDERRDDAG